MLRLELGDPHRVDALLRDQRPRHGGDGSSRNSSTSAVRIEVSWRQAQRAMPSGPSAPGPLGGSASLGAVDIAVWTTSESTTSDRRGEAVDPDPHRRPSARSSTP